MITWLAYMGRGFQSLMNVHVAPASSLRYTPALRTMYAVLALYRAPCSMLTVRMFGFLRYTPIPMRPYSPSGSPRPVSLLQVTPASVLFQSALPGPPPSKP